MNDNQPKVDQKRFVLAMVLSGIVLVIWQLFFAPEPPPPPVEGEEITAAEEAGELEEVDGDVEVDADVDEGEQPAVAIEAVAPAEDIPVSTHVIGSDLFEVLLTNVGGRVASTQIIEPEQYQAEGNLLEAFPDESRYFPFAVGFADDAITLPTRPMYAFVEGESERATPGAEGRWQKVVYRYVDPKRRFQITKTYALDVEDPYSLELQVAVTNLMGQGRISDQLALDIFGYKDPEAESSFLDMMPDQIEALCKTTDDIERETYGGVESPISFTEFETIWGGIDSRYFLFAAAPNDPAVGCLAERVGDEEEGYLRTRLLQDEFSVAPGETYAVDYDLFIGPKDYGILDKLEPSMGAAVDYGFWTFLAVPLRLFLVFVYGLVGNWGLAIILMTIAIRLVLWPINQKVYANGERMKEVQPELEKVREKYKNDQQKMTEETMRLFKENKVSPLGCAPMLLQFPILLALYYMILNSVELYQANFALWYTDLSAPDPYFVLPILMGAVMFVQQSFMTVETPNPQMKTVMKIMPLTFTAFMLFLPSGVVLYYFVSLLIGLGQQWWIKKQFADKKAAAAT